jgi:predicted DNA-binding transcriptional regulator AlpA
MSLLAPTPPSADYQRLIVLLDTQRAACIRIDAAAALCGCSRTTFWRLRIRHPDFPTSFRNGRGQRLFERAQVEAWLIARATSEGQRRAPPERKSDIPHSDKK